jgi:hypothetical protein
MKRLVLAMVVIAASLAPRAFAQASRAADADIVGLWTVVTQSPAGENTNNVQITREGSALHAVAKGENGAEAPYDSVEVSGNDVTLVITFKYQSSAMTITYKGTVDGAKMSGACDFNGAAQGTWSAVKR